MIPAAVPERVYADLRGDQLHYRRAGRAGLPALLLLHQSPSSSAMYQPLMTLLGERFRLIAPDTPGFGNSDPPAGAFAMPRAAGLLKQLLDSLHIGQCYLFGHHTGAALAVQLEHDYPGTALAMALSGPTLLSEVQRQSLPELASPIAPRDDGGHLLQMWRRVRAKDSDAPLTLSQRELLSAFDSGDAYQDSYRAECEQDFGGQLETVGCPVLVFAGDEDPLYGAVRPALERLQRGRAAQLFGGERTYVCERQAQQVADLLVEFFPHRPTDEDH